MSPVALLIMPHAEWIGEDVFSFLSLTDSLWLSLSLYHHFRPYSAIKWYKEGNTRERVWERERDRESGREKERDWITRAEKHGLYISGEFYSESIVPFLYRHTQPLENKPAVPACCRQLSGRKRPGSPPSAKKTMVSNTSEVGTSLPILLWYCQKMRVELSWGKYSLSEWTTAAQCRTLCPMTETACFWDGAIA